MDVESDVPWARVALGRKPDAINFWLGNSRSVTSLHRDNYENIYAQVVGFKHFILLPPVENPCVNEQELPAATYTLDSKGVSCSSSKIPIEGLQLSDGNVGICCNPG